MANGADKKEPRRISTRRPASSPVDLAVFQGAPSRASWQQPSPAEPCQPHIRS